MWGLGLQFLFAIIILRWDIGYQSFEWLGNRVFEFLSHADAGSEFVFGPNFRDHFIAFAVLTVIVFFSTVISVLYYLGWMQVIIRLVATVMQVTMATTAGESLHAAGNIFIGMGEAPLIIRPLIPHMTMSEVHALMTGGFATIAGSVLAAYILFGAPANHLISASVMSAPAALAMAKLFYPETETSKTTVKHLKTMEPSKERNIIEAASSGATMSIKLVANIAANLIAFMAVLHFADATLTWFGHRIGWTDPPLTFRLILSYLLYPSAFMMGIESADCLKVGRMLGVKVLLTEFIAYTELGIYIHNRELLQEHIANNGTWLYNREDIYLEGNNTTLLGGVLAERSEVITTYALCGFASFGSMGILLGTLGAIAPQRKADFATLAPRAMIAGIVASFMTASVAGLLYHGNQ